MSADLEIRTIPRKSRLRFATYFPEVGVEVPLPVGAFPKTDHVEIRPVNEKLSNRHFWLVHGMAVSSLRAAVHPVTNRFRALNVAGTMDYSKLGGVASASGWALTGKVDVCLLIAPAGTLSEDWDAAIGIRYVGP